MIILIILFCVGIYTDRYYSAKFYSEKDLQRCLFSIYKSAMAGVKSEYFDLNRSIIIDEIKYKLNQNQPYRIIKSDKNWVEPREIEEIMDFEDWIVETHNKNDTSIVHRFDYKDENSRKYWLHTKISKSSFWNILW